MIPVGYMAKRVCNRPDCFNMPAVVDIYSVSSCVNDDFADFIDYWKHNGWWLFDSPQIIQSLAHENSIELSETRLFFYEAYDKQFDGRDWKSFEPTGGSAGQILQPVQKQLEGFDVVTFYVNASPECSPLSCNGLGEKLHINSHCLFDSFDEAESNLNAGAFNGGEPGPYRIFAVYSVDWPA